MADDPEQPRWLNKLMRSQKSKSEPPVRISAGLAAVEREAAFYRDLLVQITQDARKTRARRLAESGLMFWDQMKNEIKCTDEGAGFWDCGRKQMCVKPQCEDCPRKAANGQAHARPNNP